MNACGCYRIEELGLLSTAEKFGVLSALENKCAFKPPHPAPSSETVAAVLLRWTLLTVTVNLCYRAGTRLA